MIPLFSFNISQGTDLSEFLRLAYSKLVTANGSPPVIPATLFIAVSLRPPSSGHHQFGEAADDLRALDKEHDDAQREVDLGHLGQVEGDDVHQGVCLNATWKTENMSLWQLLLLCFSPL